MANFQPTVRRPRAVLADSLRRPGAAFALRRKAPGAPVPTLAACARIHQAARQIAPAKDRYVHESLLQRERSRLVPSRRALIGANLPGFPSRRFALQRP